MKYLKESSETARKVAQVEKLMEELDISLDFAGGWIFVRVGDKTFRLMDKENYSSVPNFPRVLDSEVLSLDE